MIIYLYHTVRSLFFASLACFAFPMPAWVWGLSLQQALVPSSVLLVWWCPKASENILGLTQCFPAMIALQCKKHTYIKIALCLSGFWVAIFKNMFVSILTHPPIVESIPVSDDADEEVNCMRKAVSASRSRCLPERGGWWLGQIDETWRSWSKKNHEDSWSL